MRGERPYQNSPIAIGFSWWRCQHGCYRADGSAGQYTIVFPEQDAVLSIHAGLGDMQKELSLVWKHLLPAMASEPLAEDPQAVAALQAKCKSLTLRTVAGVRDGAEPFVGRTFETGEKRVKTYLGTGGRFEMRSR